MMSSPTTALRELLAGPAIAEMPCCFDALSAKLVEQAGFKVTFMSGFSVSASKLCMPDTQLITYSEMVEQGRQICDAVKIPVIGDGDTGYGNAVNVKRTLAGYARAGFAGIMLEDQVAPKRCGHTPGKSVVGFDEACQRIQAAVDAREEGGHDILIMARTDALASHGLDEALRRMKAFSALGADILFMEAPRNEAEMRAFCEAVPDKPKMANLVEKGATPCLPTALLDEIGYKLCARPLTLLMAAMNAMKAALEDIKEGKSDTKTDKASFEELKEVIGFPKYYAEEKRYAASSPSLSLPSSFTGGAAVEGTNVGGNTPE